VSFEDFALHQTLLTENMDRRMTEHSTSDSLGNSEATLQLYRRNVPLLHMSRYVIASLHV